MTDIESYSPKAYIYLRVSTDYQTQVDKNSFETQKRHCLDLCAKNKIEVGKIIQQVASGRKPRKELMDMINNDLNNGDFLVVYDISRLARSKEIVSSIAEILKTKNCRLLTVIEEIDTFKDDSSLIMHASIAEKESKKIAERVKSGIETKKLRGEHLGNLPYGYKFVDGKGSPLVKDDEQQKVIEMIRAWRAEGKSAYAITIQLNRRNIPTPKKSKTDAWNNKTVQLILERDDSKLLMKGKKSWYLKNQDDEETAVNEKGDDDIMKQDNVLITKYEEKPLFFLRALVFKRRLEFMLTGEEILELEKEDLIRLLK